MKNDETLWNKILAWMLCDSIPFQHWKLFKSCLCVSCFPRHHEMLPSFGARADRIMQLLLVPAVGAVTSTAQMFLPGAAPSLCNSWNKPKNSRFLLKDVSRFFNIFHISSWTEDPVLLESMPVPWLQNSDSRECHKVRIKPHVLQMCPAPKIFCKIDGLAFDECDTTYTWGFRWPWGIWLNSSSCWMAVNSTLSKIYPRTTMGICCFFLWILKKASTCKRTAWKSKCYICCNRIRLYNFSRLYVYFCFDLWWGENLPLLKVSTLLHLYCRTTPFGTLTLLRGWHQALVHERFFCVLLCSGVLLILVQFLFFFPIFFEK